MMWMGDSGSVGWAEMALWMAVLWGLVVAVVVWVVRSSRTETRSRTPRIISRRASPGVTSA